MTTEIVIDTAIKIVEPRAGLWKWVVGIIVAIVLAFIVPLIYNRRKERDNRISKVVDEYYKLVSPPKPEESSGFPVLIRAGIYTLKTDQEIEEVLQRIKKRVIMHPYGTWEKLIPKGKHKIFWDYIEGKHIFPEEMRYLAIDSILEQLDIVPKLNGDK